jgi:alternate signal-mediated exported protein
MKKKHLVAGVALAGLLAAVGGTVAYFKQTASFDNQFKLANGTVEYTENFESPTNWKSCDETPKTLVITNKTDEPVAARFKMTEYWKASGSTSTDTTSELSLIYQGQRVAIINLQNENDWERDGDWYVYKYTLQKNQSTSSLLKSVTFNCAVNFAGDMSYSADGKTSTTDTTDYQNAKYHLDITAQTVMASQKDQAWQ